MRWRLAIGVAALALALSACVPPVLLNGPSLAGTAEIGMTLTASPGEWLMSGSYTYAWQRCSAGGSGCVNIDGASQGSYTVVASDAGKQLRARVTNKNQFGAQSAYTGLSQVVPGGTSATTSRVSVASNGTQGDAQSRMPSTSADGRFVAFASLASNLAPPDNNASDDVFVHDRLTAVTERVSVAMDGSVGDAPSAMDRPAAISADGRYVAFESYASNLVPGDTNNALDVFVRDRLTASTQRVSVTSSGAQTNPLGHSRAPSISADGRFVAFESYASNLVPGDTNNGVMDVFVRDRLTGTTRRESVSSSGMQADYGGHVPVISADGQHVAFLSDATNLIPGDTNDTTDAFVRDRLSGVTERVSVASDGSQTNSYTHAYGMSISADGRHVAFVSSATNLVPGDTNFRTDLFVRDRQARVTTRVSVSTDGTQANESSERPSMSANGRYVAFRSWATNLAPGDTNAVNDVFMRDMLTGATSRVSVASDGSQAAETSNFPSISADGRVVAFQSRATTLVPGDTNTYEDIFVRQLG